jgi:prepilin peptidase CpaA
MAIAAIVAFISLMLAAAVSDIRFYRIPNWLCASVATLFIAAALIFTMPLELLGWHLLAGAAVLLVGFCLFAANIIGGGDAKLLAAAALWAGWTELPSFLFYTALAGGALAIVMMVWEVVRTHAELTAGGSPSALLKRAISLRPDLPYGVAIAFGACAFLPRSWWAAGLL